MIEYITNLSTLQMWGFALIILVIFFVAKEPIMSFIKKFWNKEDDPDTDPDYGDFLALQRLEDRAERNNSTKLADAVNQVQLSFFDSNEE